MSRVFFAVFFLSLIEPTHRIHAPDEQSNTVLQIVWEGSDHYKCVKIKKQCRGCFPRFSYSTRTRSASGRTSDVALYFDTLLNDQILTYNMLNRCTLSQSDCILLATKWDSQAINAGSPNVHKNIKYYTESGRRKRKN